MKKNLETTIKDYIKDAQVFANECKNKIDSGDFKSALSFADSLGIEPPKCSLTAKSSNADHLRAKAKRMLSDKSWWLKRLKRKAIMDFEAKQLRSGSVQHFISDELYNYCIKNKKY